jgi:hypothetical protein
MTPLLRVVIEAVSPVHTRKSRLVTPSTAADAAADARDPRDFGRSERRRDS